MKWFLCSLTVLALAGTASAEEILLNDGSEVEAEIKSIDENGMTVIYEGKTHTAKPSDIDPHFYYNEWSKRAKDSKDAAVHLKLAVFAFENGMFSQARSQYRKAERLDKDAVKQFETDVIPKIKEGVAENLLGMARKAIDNKDWNQAKRIASKILTQLEDTKAAATAREALASVHLWQLNKDEERLAKSLARYLPKDEKKALQVQDGIVKKLGPIQRHMKSASDLVTKGLRTKSANRQKGIFKQAGDRFTKAVKDLDKLAADAAGDEALLSQIAETRETAARDGIDAYVNAGQVYLIRRSYQDATQMADAALLLDPDSSQAKQFRQEVIRGSQMRNGWFGRGR